MTLLRAAGIPARLVHGIELREGTTPEELLWVEAWVAEAWVPMSAVHDFFETTPDDYIVLGRSNVALVEATGVSAIGHRFQSLREHLRPDEIASLLAPDNRALAWLSLYRLPVGWHRVQQFGQRLYENAAAQQSAGRDDDVVDAEIIDENDR